MVSNFELPMGKRLSICTITPSPHVDRILELNLYLDFSAITPVPAHHSKLRI
ncbi:hypothetical protein G816_01818 [Escherichia coli HVH 158 (4-3224287)]|nr:hypothetical protein G816_01818 [Escherichia coli HVH 158 (4-3224287)]